MEITVKRLFDKDEILSVIGNADILKTISEDGSTNLVIEPESVLFIGAYLDSELSAVFIFDRISSATFDVHAHVLPAKRHTSKDMGAAIFRHFFDIAPQAKKLIAIIPECYPNVMRYAALMGFQLEGINRASYVFGGQLINQAYLGATKDEVLNELDKG